jgi:hypothetical protein
LTALPWLKTLSKSDFFNSRRSLGSNLVAATGATSLKYVAAVLRLHAHAKAVRFLSMSVVGLVSSFHLRTLRMVCSDV